MKELYYWHQKNKITELSGRYISLDDISLLYDQLARDFIVQLEGLSVEDRPIHSVTFGKGPLKVLMWSQMHGNESTTTKAVFDLFKAFDAVQDYMPISNIKEQCTICIIPMLNPDGAHRYTRENANIVDLNRDAGQLSQAESVVLRQVYDAFAPDFCFNLHGQRSIYGFADTKTPSALSFLAPSADFERSLTLSRKRAMKVISGINKALQAFLPKQIGRYDDAFNPDCTGDRFMMEQTPTVLFEAGHAQNDYQREQSRTYVFLSIIKGLEEIAAGCKESEKGYFEIAEHSKCFYDIIIRNEKYEDIAIQYDEVLKNGTIHFMGKVEQLGDLSSYFGHKEYLVNDMIYSDLSKSEFGIGDPVKTVYLSDESTITL